MSKLQGRLAKRIVYEKGKALCSDAQSLFCMIPCILWVAKIGIFL